MKTLGLSLVSEDIYALEFKGDGVVLRITSVEKFIPHPFTVLGLKVSDIVSHVKAVK